MDVGPIATGLEAVATQQDRGMAFQHYCQAIAAHSNGVVCHYFQYYDQFCLGRPDGENYYIGLFDICNHPYSEFARAVQLTSKDGYTKPEQFTVTSPTELPRIAY